MAEAVRLKSTGPAQPVSQLSGGNQQKVLFARAIAGSPKVLLLDEPTRGVDVGAKFDIYRLIRQFCDQGLAVIMASSDLPEVIGLSDRIAVLQSGRLAHLVDNDDLTEAALLALCYDNTDRKAFA
jgi:ABC-type sugar transport system ATPase subunit